MSQDEPNKPISEQEAAEQIEHDRRKFRSNRAWIGILSVLWLGSAILAFVVGSRTLNKTLYTSISSPNSGSQIYDDAVNQITLNQVATIVLVIGALAVVASLAAAFTAYRTVPHVLNIFIGVIAVQAIISLALTIYVGVKISIVRDKWSATTRDDWNLLGNYYKDGFQYGLTCCGYKQNDGTAYTGFSNFTSDGSNRCAGKDYASTIGCYDAGKNLATQLRTLFLALCVLIEFLFSFASIYMGFYLRQPRHFQPQSGQQAY
eukprot:jgi/Hompol1/3234/HPOL_006420-RA